VIWHALASYRAGKDRRAAIVLDGKIYDLAAAAKATRSLPAAIAAAGVDALIADWSKRRRDVEALAKRAADLAGRGKLKPVAGGMGKLAAPIQPGRIFAAAANYVEHAEEMGTVLAGKANSNPYIFMKADTAVVGPGAKIVIPALSKQVDWEVELAAVIGREARFVSVDKALDYVAGYSVINDVSARDLNVRGDFPFKFDWFQGKSFDTFAPLGPWIVPKSCIGDPQKLKLELKVNGAVMQDADTGGMIFTVAEQIAYLSKIVTLRPGDVIATGTPTGVGMARGIFLKAGDVIDATIEKIGLLHNPVAGPSK